MKNSPGNLNDLMWLRAIGCYDNGHIVRKTTVKKYIEPRVGDQLLPTTSGGLAGFSESEIGRRFTKIAFHFDDTPNPA